jgi:hypothetical protein
MRVVEERTGKEVCSSLDRVETLSLNDLALDNPAPARPWFRDELEARADHG